MIEKAIKSNCKLIVKIKKTIGLFCHFLIMAIFILGNRAYAQAFRYYFNDPATSIKNQGTLFSDPWIWDGEKIRIISARGETEAFSFTVDALVDLDNIQVTTEKPIREDNVPYGGFIDVYTGYYVKVTVPSGYLGGAGIYPDALLPHEKPFDLVANNRKTFWISFETPPSCEPGFYYGTLVFSGLLFKREISFELHIMPTIIPRGTSLITRICQDLHGLKRFNPQWNPDELQFSDGRVEVSSRIRETLTKYDDFLAKYRMSPGATFLFGHPKFEWQNNKPVINFGGLEWNYRKYLDDYRLNTFGLPFNYMNLFEAEPGLRYGDDEFWLRVRLYLNTLVEWFTQHEWLEKSLVYVQGSEFAGVEGISGEPHNIGPKAYWELGKWANIIGSVSPKLKLYVIAPPYFPAPLPNLRHGIRAFGLEINDIDNDPMTQMELNQSGIITLAIPGIYSDGIDIPGFYQRALGFFCYKYGISGFDQWQSFAWDSLGEGGNGLNPWGSGDFSGIFGAGAGSLIYPSQSGDGEPISSIRFELLRDAIEDYELLKMGAEKGGLEGEYIKGLANYVLPGRMGDINPDPSRINRARRELAEIFAHNREYQVFQGKVVLVSGPEGAKSSLGTDDKSPDSGSVFGTVDKSPDSGSVFGTDDKSPDSDFVVGTDGKSPDSGSVFGTVDKDADLKLILGNSWIFTENAAFPVDINGHFRIIVPKDHPAKAFIGAKGFYQKEVDLKDNSPIFLMKKPVKRAKIISFPENPGLWLGEPEKLEITEKGASLAIVPGSAYAVQGFGEMDLSGAGILIISVDNLSDWPIKLTLGLSDKHNKSRAFPSLFGFVNKGLDKELRFDLQRLENYPFGFDEKGRIANIGQLDLKSVNSMVFSIDFGGGKLMIKDISMERPIPNLESDDEKVKKGD